MLLNKLKQKLLNFGFTSKEINLLFFLLVIFILGLSIKAFKSNYPEYRKFDYSDVDSLYSNIAYLTDTSDNFFVNKNDSVIIKELKKRKNTPKKSLDIIEKKINLNTALADDLQKLPGIGPKLADLIITYRTKIGKFKSIEELMEVKGIGEKKFNKLKNFIVIE